MQTESLPFGQSHWDYLPAEIQESILNLSFELEAIGIHREGMKKVCNSIKKYAKWKRDQKYKKLYSQRCRMCFKIFSSEISMVRHFAICDGVNPLRDFERMLMADFAGVRDLEDGFEDMYGYSVREFFGIGIGSNEEEEEEEDGWQQFVTEMSVHFADLRLL